MTILIFLMAMFIAMGCTAVDKVGETMTGWQEGWLEIHSINSGRGESFFYILPDGTTVLIDAAGANPMNKELESHGYKVAPPLPSAEITSGQVIIDYLHKYLPKVSEGRLDYAVITHYHGDHMGVTMEEMPRHEEGDFIISGITEVGSQIPIDVLIDRGEVDDRPSGNSFQKATKKRYANYIKFIDWSAKVNGTERLVSCPGAMDQIKMVHSPQDYTDFHIRTVASNGNVWDGKTDGGYTSSMPSTQELIEHGTKKGSVPENILSVVHHFSYGDFDWFTGGDCQYSGRNSFDYLDIETPISKVMGKVEGMKANHHSTKSTNSPELLSVLQPDFVIAGTWKDIHPNPATVKRFFKASPQVRFYAANVTEGSKRNLAENGVDWKKFASEQGHVVVKVAPGGKEYKILVLDDSNQEYRIKSISETYKAR